MKDWIKNHIFTSIGIAVCCCLFVITAAIGEGLFEDDGYTAYYYDDYSYEEEEYNITEEDIANGVWNMNATANEAVKRYNEMYPETPIEPYQVSSSRYGRDWEGSVIDGTIIVDFDVVGSEDYISISSRMNYNETDTAIFEEKATKWIAAIFDISHSEAEIVMTPLFMGIAREIDPGKEWYTYYKDQAIYYEVRGYSNTYQITTYGLFRESA